MTLMPGVASLEAFQRAVDEFDISSCRLSIDPAALAAARQSVDQSGLLLLGEVHGVRQNPLLARALMVALDVTGLALEWPAALASAVGGFLGDGQVPDHPQLWDGDGRITAGHFALLRERFQAQRLQALTLFDGVDEVGWSRRESAMAERILDAEGPATRTLVIAGNAHTALTPTMLGVPLGAQLAEWRPGVREITIRYGNGTCYNLLPQRFKHQFSLRRKARLRAEGGALVLDQPAPMQAQVPHRMAASQPPVTAAAGQSGYPDYPQQASPQVPPTASAPDDPRGAPAPPRPWRGRRNPYETGLTPR
jgi:hypothetical protein